MEHAPPYDHLPYGDEHPLERAVRMREERKREDAVAGHMPRAPEDAAEHRLFEIGTRQWPAVHARDFNALDMLLTSDIHAVNAKLRKDWDLSGTVGAMMDYHGYRSGNHLVEEADRLFDSLGSALDLEEPFTVYRGIGLYPEERAWSEDTWGLREACETGTVARSEVVDRGFMFASPSPSVAGQYRGERAGGVAADWKVDLELVVRRGLCLVGSEIRSKQMMLRMYDHHFLRSATSQVLIPRNSRWKPVAVTEGDAPDHRRITLEQIV